MGSINFCEFSAHSFSYFDCLFLSSPRSSLRSFFFATTAVAFSSARLALVSASSAMAPGQDRNSASPATLLPARHPPQATSLFLATVVAQHLQVETFLSSLCEQCSQPQLLNQTPQPYRATTAAGQTLHSLDCCILLSATTRNTILHRPLKVPCCFVSNLWTRELWNDRLHRPSQLVHTLELGINALSSLEATEDVRGTLPGQHRTLHLHRLASALPAPREGPAAPSNLAFPNPSVMHPAKACETRKCIAVTSMQLLDLASQSVQLDDVCLQAVPLLLHELNCSCHRNSCLELTSLISLSCKSCPRSRRR